MATDSKESNATSRIKWRCVPLYHDARYNGHVYWKERKKHDRGIGWRIIPYGVDECEVSLCIYISVSDWIFKLLGYYCRYALLHGCCYEVMGQVLDKSLMTMSMWISMSVLLSWLKL